MISLMLREAYYHYAVGNDEEAFGREQLAMEVYDNYQAKLPSDEFGRVTFPKFDILRYVGVTSFLSDTRYPIYIRQNLVKRIQIERPEIYDKLKQQNEYIQQEIEKQESMQR